MKVVNFIDTSPIRPHSLSVRDALVLVTPQARRPLCQYSDDGREVCRVSLPGNVTPRHAVMSSRGTFVVCCKVMRRADAASAAEDLHQVTTVTYHRTTVPSNSYDNSIVRGFTEERAPCPGKITRVARKRLPSDDIL